MRLDRRGLDRLGEIATEAGREIMAVYAGEFTSTRKADDSPLTEADLRADRVIRRGLEREYPGAFIQSEESASSLPPVTPQSFFLVDPLDGTKEFLSRNGEFTVNIAWIVDGEPVAGVVHAPALETMYFGARGLGAWKRTRGIEQPLQTCEVAGRTPLRVIASRSHGGDALTAWLAQVERAHEVVAAGSSLKFCRIAEGAADVYPRIGPTSQWDTAAGQAVLEAAGGFVRDAKGEPLRYGLDRPILNPNFVAIGDTSLVLPPL